MQTSYKRAADQGTRRAPNWLLACSCRASYAPEGAWAEVDEVEPDDEDSFCDEVYSPDGPSVPEGVSKVKPQMKKQQFDRQCTRTVQLYNLSESTTHADITNAVRGGMLLDVFLRAHDRYATVSFLHAADARKFFEHVRKNDLYIKNKRVSRCVKYGIRGGYILTRHPG